jgi:hypothetical protein
MRGSCARAPAQECAPTAFVDQYWGQKGEDGDAAGDLADLLVRAYARVTRVEFDRVNCNPLYNDHEAFPDMSRSSTCFDQRWSRTRFRSGSGSAVPTQIASRSVRRFAAHPTVSQIVQFAALGIAEVAQAGIRPQPDGRMERRAWLGRRVKAAGHG